MHRQITRKAQYEFVLLRPLRGKHTVNLFSAPQPKTIRSVLRAFLPPLSIRIHPRGVYIHPVELRLVARGQEHVVLSAAVLAPHLKPELLSQILHRLVVESKSLPVTIASYVEQHAANQEIVPGRVYPDEQLVSGDGTHEKMVPVSRQETSSFLGDCTLRRERFVSTSSNGA